MFHAVPLAPPNSILGLAVQCKNDPYPDKIDLCIGAYRDDSGKPIVLESVREAERLIFEGKLDHEYLTQDGLPEFTKASQKLCFGEDADVIRDGRIHTIQGISGTGSLRLAFEFLGKHFPGKTCYIPEVSWPGHPTILEESSVPIGTYRYLDASGFRLDFDSLLEDLKSFPEGSMVLFHNCAHNPTGVDPSEDQWRQILEVVKARGFLTIFDNAYQGFVSGSIHTDAFAVRLFADAGLELVAACSFAKNFGLYGERVGALHFVAEADSLPKIASQLRVISRSLYSTCPVFGARIVAFILNDPQRKLQWEEQCRAMATRLSDVRSRLFKLLVDLQVKGTWDHIVQQRGMFSYTGLPKEAVVRLRSEYHIYLLENGRISLAGLNTSNVERFARAIADVLGTETRDSPTSHL